MPKPVASAPCPSLPILEPARSLLFSPENSWLLVAPRSVAFQAGCPLGRPHPWGHPSRAPGVSALNRLLPSPTLSPRRLDPLRQEPAIHRNRLPGHKRGCIARQEDRAPHQFIHVAYPPSTGIVCPVTKEDASLARKIAHPTSSSTLPTRPIGVRPIIEEMRAGMSSALAFSGVRNTPGAIAFTRTPCVAHSHARLLVSICTPALLAE